MRTILTDIRVKGHQLHLSLKDLGSFVATDYRHTFPIKRSPENIVDWAWHELRWREALLDCERNEKNVLFDLIQAEGPINLAQSRCFSLNQLKEHLLQHRLMEECPDAVSELMDYIIENPPSARKPYSLNNLQNCLRTHPQSKKYQREINRVIDVLKEGWPIHGKDDETGKVKDKTPKVRIPAPLPEEFFRGNYSNLARWQIAPKGSIVEVNDELVKELKQGKKEIDIQDRIKYVRTRTFAEIMTEPVAILDIEMPLFRRDDAEVSWTALLHYQRGQCSGQTVFSLYNLPEEVNCFQTKKCQDKKDLVEKVKQAIIEGKPKPTVFLAYNVPFDAIKLREAGEFEIGEDESEPKKISTLKFFERIGIKSMDVLDPWKWARIQFDYLPNQKLVTIRRHLFGEEEKKEINYDQQEELELLCQGKLDPAEASGEVQALIKERSAAEVIASYVSNDVLPLADILNTEIFQRGMEDVSYLAQRFQIDPFLLMHDAKRIQDFLERKFFEKTGTFKDAVTSKIKTFMKYEQKVKNKFKRVVKNHFPADSKGRLENLTKVYLPLGRVLQPDLEFFFRETDQFYRHVDCHPADQQRRFFLARYEDALAEWMWKDYAAYLYEKDKLDKGIKDVDRDKFFSVCQSVAQQLRKRGLEEKLNRCAIAQKDLKIIAENFANLNLNEFQPLFKQWSRIRQKNRILWGAYDMGWQTFEDRLEKFCAEVDQYLTKAGIEVVHAQNRYLYLSGNTKNLYQGNDCPLIPVDEIKQAYLASGKIFYRKHGFFAGWKQEDSAQHNLSVYEMDLFAEFLETALSGRDEDALKIIWQGLEQLKAKDISQEKLVKQTKSSKRCRAYEDGKEIYFYEKDSDAPGSKTIKGEEYEIKRENDGQRDYIMEPYYDHQEKEIVYLKTFIIERDDFELDWELYQEKIGKRTKKMVLPLLGRKETKSFVQEALNETPARSLDSYLSKLDRQLGLF